MILYSPLVLSLIHISIGIFAKAGRYGGTYAYKDIAFEFGMWISPEFKIYLIKEFERLKEKENEKLGWNAKRELAKVNYHIHTDAIKENLIPKELTSKKVSVIYASEAVSYTHLPIELLWICTG